MVFNFKIVKKAVIENRRRILRNMGVGFVKNCWSQELFRQPRRDERTLSLQPEEQILFRFHKTRIIDNWVTNRDLFDVGVPFQIAERGPGGERINYSAVLQKIVESAVLHIRTFLAPNGMANVEHCRRTNRAIERAYCVLMCVSCMIRQTTAAQFLPNGTKAAPRLFFGCSACWPSREGNFTSIKRFGKAPVIDHAGGLITHAVSVFDVCLSHIFWEDGYGWNMIETESPKQTKVREVYWLLTNNVVSAQELEVLLESDTGLPLETLDPSSLFPEPY